MLNARYMVLKLSSADIQHILRSQLRTQIWDVCYDCFCSFKSVAHFTWECSNSSYQKEPLRIWKVYLRLSTILNFAFFLGIWHMGLQQISCTTLQGCLWLSHLRFVKSELSPYDCLGQFDSLTYFSLTDRYMETKQPHPKTALKCSIPLTSLLLMYVCMDCSNAYLFSSFFSFIIVFPCFLNINYIWGEEICSWLKCVWYHDFEDQKCDFKSNCRKCIVWECFLKNAIWKCIILKANMWFYWTFNFVYKNRVFKLQFLNRKLKWTIRVSLVGSYFSN